MTASLLPAPTIWQPGVRVGSQAPRVRSVPPYASTLGDEAADLMAEVGKPLLPWQREFCRDMLGRRADGKWSAYESGLFEARQNGKGVVIEARELYSLFILRTRRIIHSAHLFDTSREAFERLMEIIDGSDWLTKRVARVNRAHGKEGIELTTRAGGGQLKYKARTLHGARGFSGEDIILDEAYALVAGHMAAISPILATLPNPYIGYFSSPPDDKTGPMPEDAFLPSVRRRGLAGQPRLNYWEFSPPGSFDPADVDVWYACNPSLGYLIQEEYLADQYRIFESAGKVSNFATEHLGVWPVDAATHWAVISEADWSALTADQQSSALDPLVFSIDVTPERSHGSIAAVGARADGDLHGEVVDHGPGTSWLAERAVELNQRWRPAFWVLDPGGAAGFLLPQLEAAGLVVETMTTRQVGQAFGLFRSSASSAEQAEAPTSEATLTGAPVEPEAPLVVPKIRIRLNRHGGALSAAVEGAATRRVGDGTSWDRKSNAVVISPLVALTNAMFGFVTRPPVETNEPWVMYG